MCFFFIGDDLCPLTSVFSHADQSASFISLPQAIDRERPEKYRKLQEATRTAQTLVEQGTRALMHRHAHPVCPHGNASTCPTLAARLHRNTDRETQEEKGTEMYLCVHPHLCPCVILGIPESRRARNFSFQFPFIYLFLTTVSFS